MEFPPPKLPPISSRPPRRVAITERVVYEARTHRSSVPPDTPSTGNPNQRLRGATQGGSAPKVGAGIIAAQATARDPIRHPKPHGKPPCLLPLRDARNRLSVHPTRGEGCAARNGDALLAKCSRPSACGILRSPSACWDSSPQPIPRMQHVGDVAGEKRPTFCYRRVPPRSPMRPAVWHPIFSTHPLSGVRNARIHAFEARHRLFPTRAQCHHPRIGNAALNETSGTSALPILQRRGI